MSKESRKIMMDIHTPLLDEKTRSKIEKKRTIIQNNMFAKPVIPFGSWKTNETNLRYLEYDDNDKEYYIKLDNETVLCNCKKVFIKDVIWDRVGDLEQKTIKVRLEPKEKFTEYTLVREIKDFYQSNLTNDELEQLANYTEEYNDIAEQALNKRKKNPNYIIKRYKVLGDLLWFEGLLPVEIKDNTATYRLLIGS